MVYNVFKSVFSGQIVSKPSQHCSIANVDKTLYKITISAKMQDVWGRKKYISAQRQRGHLRKPTQ